MPAASSLTQFGSGATDAELELLEMDPRYADTIGLQQGDVVSVFLF
jgi:hypothetical protein